MYDTATQPQIDLIEEESPERSWRTEVPNIILTIGLTPYELALYVHLKRTAGGEGKCWKGARRLALETGMSLGQVTKCKESLALPRVQLGGKALIRIEEFRDEDKNPRHRIVIVNIWPENIALFAGQGGVHTVNTPVHVVNTGVHTMNEGRNPIGSNIPPTPLKPEPRAPRSSGRVNRLPTSEFAIKISQLFRRKLTTEWSDKEIKAFKKLVPFDAEEFALIERYYAAERAKGDGIHRRDIYTFLNNYPGELDRARLWDQSKHHEQKNQSNRRQGPAREGSRNAGTCNENAAAQYKGFERLRPESGEDQPGQVGVV